jgi:hypothetical protein
MFDKKNLKKISDNIKSIPTWKSSLIYIISIAILLFVVTIFGILATVGMQTVIEKQPQYGIFLEFIFNVCISLIYLVMVFVYITTFIILLQSLIDYYLEKTKDEL